ncbi:MAG: sugar transferase [Paracoccaceae bacterium]
MTMQVEKNFSGTDHAQMQAGLVVIDPQAGLYRNHFKRVFDLAIASLIGTVALPVTLLLAILLLLCGTQPFYASDRVGMFGRTFRMYKLRTMVDDADQRLETYLSSNAAARAEWNETQKLKRDPRVTWLGKWLRKTSLDELPQIWNVFKGDMSLVGPRPMMPSQRSMYHGDAYYGVRPGVTGIWQISDRNESAFEKRAELDAVYDAQLSLSVDIAILVRTVGTVARGTGY